MSSEKVLSDVPGWPRLINQWRKLRAKLNIFWTYRPSTPPPEAWLDPDHPEGGAGNLVHLSIGQDDREIINMSSPDRLHLWVAYTFNSHPLV